MDVELPKRSSNGAFCILLISDDGALTTRRFGRVGGGLSYSTVIIWPTKIKQLQKKTSGCAGKGLPLAVAPLYCVMALAASLGNSYVMMATPEERPLRSYFKL